MNTESKLRTPAQIEASRRNGAKSRGPKTPEGRARSSQNARTYGLTASVVSDYEDPELFDQFLASYINTYEPVGAAENQLVREITRCAWRLERANRVESGLLNHKMDSQRDWIEERYGDIEPAARVALAFGGLVNWGVDLQVLYRYEVGCRRGLIAATRSLVRMQSERRRAATAQDANFLELRNEPGHAPGDLPIPLNRQTLIGPTPARVPLGFPLPEPAAANSIEVKSI
jgi:hypothetical protein